jgi:hypothetical protein
VIGRHQHETLLGGDGQPLETLRIGERQPHDGCIVAMFGRGHQAAGGVIPAGLAYEKRGRGRGSFKPGTYGWEHAATDPGADPDRERGGRLGRGRREVVFRLLPGGQHLPRPGKQCGPGRGQPDCTPVAREQPHPQLVLQGPDLCFDSAGWLMNSDSAARPKCRCSATATK